MVRGGTIGWLVAYLMVVAAACGSGESQDGSADPSATTTGATAAPATAAPADGDVPWPTEGWKVSTPEQQGMSSSELATLVQVVDDVDSVTIVRNGHIVLDAVFYPFPEDKIHQTHSATKSFTATLIGMALDQGLLPRLDVPVVDLLPDDAPDEIDALKAASTVEHFLTMTHGLDCQDSWKYDWRGYLEMAESDNWVAHTLALPMLHEPGTYFEYCNGASVVLSGIVSEVTGETAAAFADEVLFGPLGITDFEWTTVPPGVSNGEDSLYLHPHDMAKFGYLYLRGGEWDGQQILPEEWVDVATMEHTRDPDFPYGPGYGYQWWTLDDGYQAAGLGGQIIRVIPDLDLVVVFTAGLANSRQTDHWMRTYVLPAVVSDAPLPADRDAQERLANAVAAAAVGPEPQPVALPDIAPEIDGVWFEARDNDEGWKGGQIQFHDDMMITSGEDADGPYQHEVGLDGRFRIDEEDQVALRGEWRGDDRFVVEGNIIGEAMRVTEVWSFEGDTVTIRRLNTVTGESTTLVADRVD